jgi:hypothetical protein
VTGPFSIQLMSSHSLSRQRRRRARRQHTYPMVISFGQYETFAANGHTDDAIADLAHELGHDGFRISGW